MNRMIAIEHTTDGFTIKGEDRSLLPQIVKVSASYAGYCEPNDRTIMDTTLTVHRMLDAELKRVRA